MASQGENAYLCAHRPHPAVGYKDAIAAHGQSDKALVKDVFATFKHMRCDLDIRSGPQPDIAR